MKYVIIGNGVAGTTAAESIRKTDPDSEIIIFTDEETPFYSRIRLIEFLAGEASGEDIVIHKQDWYDSRNIQVRLESVIETVDAENHSLMSSSGEQIGYDRLLLATGGVSFIPQIPGSDKKGVFTLRSIQNARDILSYAEGKGKVVLIGGGVLGLEAGNSLRKKGCEISVVEFFPRLLPRQMDPQGADILKSQMESMGFSFYLGAKTKDIGGGENTETVALEDGTVLNADLVVISAGIRPRSELALKLGLSVNKGLVVNDRMETEKEHIYAAGDIIEHRDRFYGIWPAAQEQGEVAGINMAGGSALYEGTTMSNKLKVAGIDLAAAGDIDPDNQYESFIVADKENFLYKKLVIKDNVLAGCIMLGDTSGFNTVLKAIETKKDAGDIKDRISQWDLSALR